MALYHTHRPQDYAELIGQETIVRTLASQVALGKVAHAYLFSGPRGVGKTTSARILAKAVNCTNRKNGASEPCNACTSCQEITAGNAIDVMEIDAASNTGVDNVRTNIIENAQFRPTKSKYKVFIIDEVHMLSTSAFNALLKIMEEPPQHVLFILATTELNKIPDTIISRCQRFTFKRVPFDLMKQHLAAVAQREHITVDSDVLDRIAAKSDGCVRDGMSLLDQLMALGSTHITAESAALVLPTANREQTIQFVVALLNKQAKDAVELIAAIAAEQSDMVAVADDTIDVLRMIMILQVYPESSIIAADMNKETRDHLHAIGSSEPTENLVALTDIFLRRRQEIKSSPLAQLPLEMAIMEWCFQPQPMPTSVQPPKNTPPPPETTNKASQKIAPPTAPTPAPAEKERKEPAPPAPEPTDAADITERMVEQAWPTFLTTLEKTNPSLIFILKMVRISGVKQNTITLTAPYSFHKDKLMDIKCRETIQQIFSGLLNAKMSIDVTVAEQGNTAAKSDVQELAAMIGGDVV